MHNLKTLVVMNTIITFRSDRQPWIFVDQGS